MKFISKTFRNKFHNKCIKYDLYYLLYFYCKYIINSKIFNFYKKIEVLEILVLMKNKF